MRVSCSATVLELWEMMKGVVTLLLPLTEHKFIFQPSYMYLGTLRELFSTHVHFLLAFTL
jgi:hypothetical protein